MEKDNNTKSLSSREGRVAVQSSSTSKEVNDMFRSMSKKGVNGYLDYLLEVRSSK